MASLSQRVALVAMTLAVFSMPSLVRAEGPAAESESPPDVRSGSPTWLLTVPTADVMPQGEYVVGVVQGGTIPFHADVGALWKSLQVGVHGVKLQILEEGKPWAGLAVGATFGYYPSGVYLVGSKSIKDLRLHVGARMIPFDFGEDASGDAMADTSSTAAPASTDAMSTDSAESFSDTFELFAAIEKRMSEERVRMILEVANTLNGGFRFDVSPSWHFDVGVRVGLPERIRRTIGAKGEAFAFTSRDATAYLAFSYASDWRTMGPPKEIPDVSAGPSQETR